MNRLTPILLTLNYIRNGLKLKIHPTLIRSEDFFVLVDCGHPGDLEKLKIAIEEHGVMINDLTHLIITHHDHDHMGAAAELKRACPNLKIVSLTEEVKYIEGKSKSLRLEQAEMMYPYLPDNEKASAIKFQEYLKSVENLKVDLPVSHESYLDLKGEIQFLSTPGHMPGHLSVYLPRLKCLITGDALMVSKGKLMIPKAQYSMDQIMVINTLESLRKYPISKCLCYHGGIYEGPFSQDIKNLIDRYQ